MSIRVLVGCECSSVRGSLSRGRSHTFTGIADAMALQWFPIVSEYFSRRGGVPCVERGQSDAMSTPAVL